MVGHLPPDPDWEDANRRIRDSRKTKLDATVWTDWLKLTYEYDLGDSWRRHAELCGMRKTHQRSALTEPSKYMHKKPLLPSLFSHDKIEPKHDST
jgi:hypothetical protein